MLYTCKNNIYAYKNKNVFHAVYTVKAYLFNYQYSESFTLNLKQFIKFKCII